MMRNYALLVAALVFSILQVCHALADASGPPVRVMPGFEPLNPERSDTDDAKKSVIRTQKLSRQGSRNKTPAIFRTQVC